MIPPQKPEQKTPFIDKLKNLRNFAPGLMSRSNVDIIKLYMDEAVKDGEITQDQYTEMLMPYFGELGEKVTEQIEKSDRENFAIGGGQFQGQDMGTREGFSKLYGPNIRKLTKSDSFEVQMVRGGTGGGKGGQKFYKTFNFSDYGSEANALKAAEEYRDSIPKIKKDTGKFSKGQPIGFKKQTGGQAEIRKALNDIIKVGGKSFSNEDLRKLVDMDLFPNDDQFRKAVDVVKKESEFKNLKFEKKPRPRLNNDPVSVLQAKTRKRRSKKLDILGSKDYEKELYKFKKEVQEGLGLEPVKTTGAISGKPREFLPIDMGHQSSIDQLKLLKQQLRPEDLNPQFYKANREGIRKFEGGVRTLEASLKKDFYPEQKKLYNQAKKFIDAGESVPADLQNKIVASNEKIQKFINNTVEKYPLLKDRVNAITIDANDLTVRRGGNVLKELGIGLVDQDLGNIKLNSLDDLTIKANLAQQTLQEAVDAGLIEKNTGQQKLNKFLNVRDPRIDELLKTPGVTTADQIPTPEKTQTRNMFEAATKRFSDGPKLQARIPGLSDLLETAKSIPDDFKKAKYVTAGLKTLGVVATPIVAYDTYKAFEEGKPAFEALEQGLIGTNLIGSTKDLMALSPEGREARSVVKQGEMREQIADDFSGLDTDFDTPNLKSEMSRQEAERKYENEKIAIGRKRAAQEKALANARAISIEGLKNLITGEKFVGQQIPEQFLAVGGRVGFADGPDDPKRRTFMKIAGGIASIPFVGKYFKAAAPVAEKTVEIIRRGADGIPDFIMDLIAKVKLKAEEKGMKYFTGNRSDEFANVYQADDFVVTEQGNKITIKKRKQEGDMLEKDMEMEIETDPETGGVTYNEATARPDAEGKLKDIEEYIDEIDLEDMKKYTYDE